MTKIKQVQTPNRHVIEYHIHIVEGTKIGDIILPKWFKITKSQLTDLVQVGSFFMDKIDLTITIDMVESYQEVHVWKQIQRQTNPQGLVDCSAQESLSYSTGIQIMEEAGEIPCSLELDMAMANESENIQ